MGEPEMIQVVMTPVVRRAFERWLADRRCSLFPMPHREDDLPTYGIRNDDPNHC